ncbi:MAG: hypothetical protein ACRYFU_02255 [Janthinobacterium lividum]
MHLRFILAASVLLFTSLAAHADELTFTYDGAVSFPLASFPTPYFTTVNSFGFYDVPVVSGDTNHSEEVAIVDFPSGDYAFVLAGSPVYLGTSGIGINCGPDPCGSLQMIRSPTCWKRDLTRISGGKIHRNSLSRSVPVLGLRLSGNLEEAIHKADPMVDAWPAGEAVSAPNHPHDLKALDCGGRCLHRLETVCGSDDPLECTMICFNDVVQVLRRAMSCVFGQPTFSVEPVDCFRIGRKLSVVIDVGGQSAWWP